MPAQRRLIDTQSRLTAGSYLIQPTNLPAYYRSIRKVLQNNTIENIWNRYLLTSKTVSPTSITILRPDHMLCKHLHSIYCNDKHIIIYFLINAFYKR